MIAYYAFFSLFPLLLAFVSILGFVLQGDPAAQQTIVHSALTQFPIVGAQPGSLAGQRRRPGHRARPGRCVSGLGVTLATRTRSNRLHDSAARAVRTSSSRAGAG